jgi:hypothetical protein
VVLHSHVGTGLWIYNPTIAVRTGHVTVVAHNRNACAGGDVTGLAEYDYDTVTGLVDATRVIDSGCEEVGHAQLQWAAATSTYHVCWTRKTVALSDEVLCSTRPAVGGWAAATNLNGAGLALAQDHASLAVRNTNGSPRYAFHSRVAGGGPDADEAAMQFHGPGGTVTTQTAPSTRARCRGPTTSSDRSWRCPPDDRIHVAWEDRTGTDSIWYPAVPKRDAARLRRRRRVGARPERDLGRRARLRALPAPAHHAQPHLGELRAGGRWSHGGGRGPPLLDRRAPPTPGRSRTRTRPASSTSRPRSTARPTCRRASCPSGSCSNPGSRRSSRSCTAASWRWSRAAPTPSAASTRSSTPASRPTVP